MRFNAVLSAVCGVVLLSGCAAQSYARLAPVSTGDAASCAHVEMEIFRAQGFLAEVRNGGHPWWAAAAHVGDLGAGNGQERAAARRSAEMRLAQLEAARASLGCAAPAGVEI